MDSSNVDSTSGTALGMRPLTNPYVQPQRQRARQRSPTRARALAPRSIFFAAATLTCTGIVNATMTVYTKEFVHGGGMTGVRHLRPAINSVLEAVVAWSSRSGNRTFPIALIGDAVTKLPMNVEAGPNVFVDPNETAEVIEGQVLACYAIHSAARGVRGRSGMRSWEDVCSQISLCKREKVDPRAWSSIKRRSIRDS